MNVKKAIKNVVSLGMGVTMVGSTIMGAMAATISDYPAPFTEGGEFSALMVIGAASKPMDMIGVTDIATSLQFATKKSVSENTVVTLGGESALLSSGSDRIYLLDELSLGGVTTLTEDELPTILADGTFEDDSGSETDYTQSIDVGSVANNPEFDFGKSGSDLDDPALIIDLGTNSAKPMYSYVVEFDSAIDFTDATDVQGEKIEMFGKEYTIGTDSTNGDGIQLLGGSMDVSMAWGETKMVTFEGEEYELTLEGISDDNPDTATLTVDGESADITQGNTKRISGLDVYADTVSYYGLESDPGRATFSLGSNEIWLDHGEEVKLGSSKDSIDNTAVTLTGTAISAVTAIQVDVAAQDSDYDHLEVGDYYEDPVFGAIKVTFSDVQNGPDLSERDDASTSRRKIEVEEATTSALQVTLTDNNNNQATLPFAYDTDTTNNNNLYLADEDGYTIAIVEGTDISTDESYVILNHGGDYVAFGQVKTIENADCTTMDLTIKDVFTGEDVVNWDNQAVDTTKTFSYKSKTFTVTCADGGAVSIADATATTLNVFPYVELYSGYDQRVAWVEDVDITGMTANVTVQLPTGSVTYNEATNNVTADSVEYDTAAAAKSILVGTVYYVFDGTVDDVLDIGLDATQDATPGEETQAALLIVEEEDASNSDAKEAIIINVDDDGTDNKAQVEAPWFSDTEVSSAFDNTDYTGYIDAFGSYALLNVGGDQDVVSVTVPKEQMYANVYISELAASSTTTSTGLSEPVAIDAGAVKFDTDIADYTAQNLIVVGGPCVNTIASTLMGNPANCAEGFEDGKAMIKLFNHDNGKVALLVAGYSATDTTAACHWLHNYAENSATLAMADSSDEMVELAVASVDSVTPTVK